MWMWTHACSFTHLCVHMCVSADVCARAPETHSQALPCEIRLICRWCRSSFMINSPVCWKQCSCALTTCGTDVNYTRVWATARLTAGLPTLTSCSGCVDVVNAVERESTACHKSCVLCMVFAGRLLDARACVCVIAWTKEWVISCVTSASARFKEVGDVKCKTQPLQAAADGEHDYVTIKIR